MLSNGAPIPLVRLRPRADTLHLSQGRTVLATGRDGFLAGHAEQGLFVAETRMLSHYRWLINGEPPTPVALSNIEQHSWLGYYITLPPGVDPGEEDEGSGMMETKSEKTLELRLSRTASCGVHEDLDLTNFSQITTSFQLELEVDADFADVVETKGNRRQHGKLERTWRGEQRELCFDYRAENEYDHQGHRGTARLHRGLALRIDRCASEPSYAEGRIRFQIQLGPGEIWHACISMIPIVEGEAIPPLYGCHFAAGADNFHERRRQLFLEEATAFSTPGSGTLSQIVVGALEQAKIDLVALRLYDLDRDDRAWTMTAGLPIYVALFGRDTLTAAWQAAMVDVGPLRGTLPKLAEWQGEKVDDWRDEQPGRMLHEAHTGPLEELHFNPRSRYYGSLTTSGFYPVAVSELWHWTGDKELVRPLLDPALKALRWLDEYADFDGDGFSEYKTRSKQGVKHQGWKDSPDAIVYEDGSQVEPPISPCEEQGFAYLAKLQLAEVLWWFDEKEEAKRLYREAGELKERFNEAFWMEEEGFLAMGLDAQNRPIRSIGSNAGHCLACGIIESSLATRVADRLLADDLFSGWGVRTLSSAHPAYNPYSYHRGSVWPVEQGTFALGFMRYGLHDHLEKLCRAVFEAASCFDFYRLPEVFSGHGRDREHPFPAYYPQANSPQAWSATTIFSLLQALLGLYPYAPLHLLLIDPHLPAWLPEITLSGLRIGEAAVTIRFYRKSNGESSYEVLEKRGSLHVLRQPSPWSQTATVPERMIDALASLLPGK